MYDFPVKGCLRTRQAGDEPVEDRRMDRLDEVHAGIEALDPANLGLERLKAVELDPQLLFEPRPLDELEPAPVE